MSDLKTQARNFSEEKTKKNFSKVVWIYDFWSNLTEKKALSEALVLANITPGETILDVATGTGQMLKEIVKRNPSGHNSGIDLSPDMLEKAKVRLSEFDSDHYYLNVGNAYQLPFEDASFDLLFNNYMLDMLPEKDFSLIFDEFYRVLKSGGRVVITSMSLGKKWYNRFWYYIAKWFPELMTYCRPVPLTDHLVKSRFKIIKSKQVSQNTFPSIVVLAVKI